MTIVATQRPIYADILRAIRQNDPFRMREVTLKTYFKRAGRPRIG